MTLNFLYHDLRPPDIQNNQTLEEALFLRESGALQIGDVTQELLGEKL